DVDRQEQEQDAAADAHARQADADATQEIVAEEREYEQEARGDERGAPGDAPLLGSRVLLGEHGEDGGTLDRVDRDEQGGERRADEWGHRDGTGGGVRPPGFRRAASVGVVFTPTPYAGARPAVKPPRRLPACWASRTGAAPGLCACRSAM